VFVVFANVFVRGWCLREAKAVKVANTMHGLVDGSQESFASQSAKSREAKEFVMFMEMLTPVISECNRLPLALVSAEIFILELRLG
jgi:hypothetical protein